MMSSAAQLTLLDLTEIVCDPIAIEFNYDLCLQLVDIVNGHPESSLLEKMVKALRKNVQSKVFKQSMYALNTLQLLMSNCSLPVYAAVSNKKLMAEFKKIITKAGTKREGLEKREKCLELLSTWNNMFLHNAGGRLGKEVMDLYNKLKSKSVIFPEPDRNVRFKATITHASNSISSSSGTKLFGTSKSFGSFRKKDKDMAKQQYGEVPIAAYDYAVNNDQAAADLKAAQRLSMTSLQDQMNEMNNVAEMLSSILNTLESKADFDGNDILLEMYNKCLQNQKDVVGLIQVSSHNEDQVNKLLKTNDTINDAVELFERIAIDGIPQDGSPPFAVPMVTGHLVTEKKVHVKPEQVLEDLDTSDSSSDSSIGDDDDDAKFVSKQATTRSTAAPSIDLLSFDDHDGHMAAGAPVMTPITLNTDVNQQPFFNQNLISPIAAAASPPLNRNHVHNPSLTSPIALQSQGGMTNQFNNMSIQHSPGHSSAYSSPGQNQVNTSMYSSPAQLQANTSTYSSPAHLQANASTYSSPAQQQQPGNSFDPFAPMNTSSSSQLNTSTTSNNPFETMQPPQQPQQHNQQNSYNPFE